MDKYRFYVCEKTWNGLQCDRVYDSCIFNNKHNTQLLFVNSIIPNCFDKPILFMKSLNTHVDIKPRQPEKANEN